MIAQVEYDGGTEFPDPTGASMTLDPDHFTYADAQVGANWCEASSVYSDPNLGTPRSPNDLCSGSGLSGLTPSTGLHAGGLSVAITGAGFTGVTEVLFGGTSAADFAFISDTEITATTPAHTAGSVDVTCRRSGDHLT